MTVKKVYITDSANSYVISRTVGLVLHSSRCDPHLLRIMRVTCAINIHPQLRYQTLTTELGDVTHFGSLIRPQILYLLKQSSDEMQGEDEHEQRHASSQSLFQVVSPLCRSTEFDCLSVTALPKVRNQVLTRTRDWWPLQ